MKTKLFFFLALVAFSNAVMAQAEMSTDEAEIKTLVQTLVNGLLKKNAELMGTSLADDVVFITPGGHLLNSRQEVVSFHEQALKMMPPNYTFSVEVKDVQFVRPDLAIARISGSGSFEMEGKKMMDVQHAGITAIKENGSWKIIHFGATPVQPQG
ncbi:SgcJ/EcaC family oxidoreductase [Flavilitoribacter nigricans]|uniref:DUF4440 domain-containing protein n=1 Tax=Flavilitoribacter nigricans (strain ATCC 23147 / DSM 23189 / NBRC 102662 / NCIMB 1420 / SS-2) TaxID=1122177 RepID=A0A2D0NHA0_FLAN2|nr:SgcJ/EcaC family oxidoreductase [Flavilitoribacter nigricans]PHN07874.1 hypothetical protein CRP01_03740 [Flavilitoribacter nigricans DSM 23189 = NBRC 102662]